MWILIRTYLLFDFFKVFISINCKLLPLSFKMFFNGVSPIKGILLIHFLLFYEHLQYQKAFVYLMKLCHISLRLYLPFIELVIKVFLSLISFFTSSMKSLLKFLRIKLEEMRYKCSYIKRFPRYVIIHTKYLILKQHFD